MEAQLLKVFAQHRGRILNRDQLLELAHDRGWEPFDRSIDIRISRLRRKITAGAHFIMSQPVYDADEFERFMDYLGPLPIPLLVGVMPLKIPELANECVAYVPESYNPKLAYGVLVWLHVPGGFKQEELLDLWKKHCDLHDLILLAPKSADPSRWEPTEARLVRRVLDEAYGLADAALAKRRLTQVAAGLDHTHPGAAASLHEGLDETLTLQRLGV